MTRRRKMILLGLLAAVPLAVAGTYFGLQGLRGLMRPIPIKPMWLVWHDVDGTTTLDTEKFAVSFEGDTMGGGRSSGGNWVIDGRPSNWTPWPNTHYESVISPGQALATGYSGNQRMFTASHLGHEIRYYDYRRLLVIDGHEFSLQEGPVHVVIAKTGELRLAPFVPSETIAEMKKAAGPKLP